MTQPPGSDADTSKLAWEHVYSASPPELRRWLDSARPLALHQDALMLAVPNTFTRNQLEGRFRQGIEQELTTYFRRSMQLAVIVDEQLTPVPLPMPDQTATSHCRARSRASTGGRGLNSARLDDVSAQLRRSDGRSAVGAEAELR